MPGTAHLITEKALQNAIVEAAHRLGWWTHHHYDARRSTPGFPDLVLIRDGQIIFAELKREDGKVSAHQARVLELLEGCGLEVHVWRPSHLDDVIARLQERHQ